MKAFKFKCSVAVFLTVATVLVLMFFTLPADTVYASSHSGEDSDSYSYIIDNFEAVYEIDESGYMCVTETLSVTYTGAKSYSVTRTLVNDSGDRVRNVAIYEEENGEYVSAEYTIDSESGDVAIEIGDEDSKTNESHTYIIYYEYFSTEYIENTLAFYPFSGIDAEITYAVITLNLPCTCSITFKLDGSEKYSANSDTATIILQNVANGAILTAGVTSDGTAIGGHSDLTSYYALIILAVLAIALVVVKLIFFNKYKLEKDLRREPPFGYDPLIVGKLVDNSVSDSDVASLIFHWAAKGYVKINLKDASKPVITKMRDLPAIAPDYQQMLFYKLFKHTNAAYIDELDDDFYKTTEAVKKAVDKKASGSYINISMGLSVLFAVLSAFVVGGAPTIYAMTEVSSHYIYITSLIFALPPLVVYGLTESLMYNRYKLHGKIFAEYMAGIIAISAIFTALYVWIIPSNLIELVPKINICILSYALCIASTVLITRTEKYTEQLGAILGFRKFIKSSQHVELRETAAKNPQLFYEIYPYAEVLNLEKEWTDKFYSMNVRPPEWCEGVAKQGEVTAEITTAMKTARLKISTAISTSPSK